MPKRTWLVGVMMLVSTIALVPSAQATLCDWGNESEAECAQNRANDVYDYVQRVPSEALTTAREIYCEHFGDPGDPNCA